MTILIVYFSWKEHTRRVAIALKELLQADIIRIEPAKPVRIVREGIKAALTLKSAILPVKTDLSDVDTLIIASPVWSGKVPSYVNEYLDRVENGSGKPFYVVVEMGGRGAAGAIATIGKRLEQKGMTLISSVVTIEKDVDSGEYENNIKSFAYSIRKRDEVSS